MRLCLVMILLFALMPLGIFAKQVPGKLKVCQQKSGIEKPSIEKGGGEKPQFVKPEIERIRLNKVPSAVEGIRASIQRPEFAKPEFDKSTFQDNCKEDKQPSENIQKLLRQQDLPPSIARMIKDALKLKQTPRPGECPCTATTVSPRK